MVREFLHFLNFCFFKTNKIFTGLAKHDFLSNIIVTLMLMPNVTLSVKT